MADAEQVHSHRQQRAVAGADEEALHLLRVVHAHRQLRAVADMDADEHQSRAEQIIDTCRRWMCAAMIDAVDKQELRSVLQRSGVAMRSAKRLDGWMSTFARALYLPTRCGTAEPWEKRWI